MNTNMAGFRWFSKIFASLCLERNLASTLLGLSYINIPFEKDNYFFCYKYEHNKSKLSQLKTVQIKTI